MVAKGLQGSSKHHQRSKSAPGISIKDIEEEELLIDDSPTSYTNKQLYKEKQASDTISALPSTIEDFEKLGTFSIYSNDKELKKVHNRWVQEGWPVQLLQSDPVGARVLQDNALFSSAKFHNHKWEWDPNDGLIILFENKMTPWSTIRPQIRLANSVGWLVFDGYIYGPNGLCRGHLWKWEQLSPSFIWATGHECYLDIISCSWEHSGLQGFGMLGGPHGHVYLELGDGDGNVYSVGQYPDPMRENRALRYVYGTCKAVLMSPDPYTTASGEKVIHRYTLGRGEQGKNNVNKILEIIQSWNKSGSLLHNAVSNNCCDFVVSIEKYVQREMKECMICDLSFESNFPPGRTRVDLDHNPSSPMGLPIQSIRYKRKNLLSRTGSYLYHRWIILLVDLLLNLFFWIPVLSKILGRGVGVEDVTSQQEKNRRKKNLGALTLRWKAPNWPRKLRVQQQFSPRLGKFSVTLTCS
ncbi:hypothetical protein AKO1_012195 [Acrasis kona]|uniref:Uncharacterized protein n=1 Tax=Acrasis kona TaxID=1008807 RepID=A0AAW2ZBN8_9EUKA